MKKILNTKLKDMNAITLIALVITIVVLIILATVVVNLSLGDNGIFNRAREAKEEYQNAQSYEETEIAKTTNQINNFVNNNRDIEDTTPIIIPITLTDVGNNLVTLSVNDLKKSGHVYAGNIVFSWKSTANITASTAYTIATIDPQYAPTSAVGGLAMVGLSNYSLEIGIIKDTGEIYIRPHNADVKSSGWFSFDFAYIK